MRLLFAVLLFLGIACTSPRADDLGGLSPARVVSQGAAQLTMEVQELI